MKLTASEVTSTSTIYSTMDYDKFKILPGNRPVDKKHVALLVKRLTERNLNPTIPLEVNADLEILDGQHRLLALEEIKAPVFYIIRHGLNIDDVIQLNSGTRNWTWKDFAQSYDERGNKNYTQFLKLYEEYRLPFSVLLQYCGENNVKVKFGKSGRMFNDGEFVMKDYETTSMLLGQFTDIQNIINVKLTNFSKAVYAFIRRRGYDHKFMLEQLTKYGAGLLTCYFVVDFLNELEAIYETRDDSFTSI